MLTQSSSNQKWEGIPSQRENNPLILKMAVPERLHLKHPKSTHTKNTHKTMEKDFFVSSCSLQIVRLHGAHSVWLGIQRFSMISQRDSGRNSGALTITHFSRPGKTSILARGEHSLELALKIGLGKKICKLSPRISCYYKHTSDFSSVSGFAHFTHSERGSLPKNS